MAAAGGGGGMMGGLTEALLRPSFMSMSKHTWVDVPSFANILSYLGCSKGRKLKEGS